ncbi:efflux RND transporter permease subunit, partial [bacterium]|nr:efflux RND transporter permease subunit [bacterium]
MSRLLTSLLARRRLVLATAFLLAATGLAAWITMPRQEDPRLADRWALAVTVFPGADAENMERLVVDPIEEHLAEVEEIKKLKTTIRQGVAIMVLELVDKVDDPDSVWDEVRRTLAEAHAELPDGVHETELDEDLMDPESIVLAISGSGDPLVLADAAEEVKRSLLGLPRVSGVTIVGDPGEQITIEYDDYQTRRLGLDPRLLAAQLSARNVTIPAGSLRIGDRTANLRPS